MIACVAAENAGGARGGPGCRGDAGVLVSVSCRRVVWLRLLLQVRMWLVEWRQYDACCDARLVVQEQAGDMSVKRCVVTS